jgi:hypothetical protein
VREGLGQPAGQDAGEGLVQLRPGDGGGQLGLAVEQPRLGQLLGDRRQLAAVDADALTEDVFGLLRRQPGRHLAVEIELTGPQLDDLITQAKRFRPVLPRRGFVDTPQSVLLLDLHRRPNTYGRRTDPSTLQETHAVDRG